MDDEHPTTDAAVTVDEILAIDRALRSSRAPRLHTVRDGRKFTAVYSTSALAEQFHRTRDWVIVEVEVPGPNPRWTVVTERRGVLRGKRVVRSREVECFQWYRGRRRAA